MLLSIFAPIYNTEGYLRRCFDSIASNDTEEYEAILVNDGSTDNSRLICEEFADRYPRNSGCFTKKTAACHRRAITDYGMEPMEGIFCFWIWMIILRLDFWTEYASCCLGRSLPEERIQKDRDISHKRGMINYTCWGKHMILKYLVKLYGIHFCGFLLYVRRKWKRMGEIIFVGQSERRKI